MLSICFSLKRSAIMASLMVALSVAGPNITAADVTNGPSFTILNRSGQSSSQAKFYYLGYGTINNEFYVLLQDGTWKKAKDGTVPSGDTVSDTGWNATGWNPQSNGNKGAQTGSGVVPCYLLDATPTNGPKIYIPEWSGSGTNPKQAPSMRVYFFQVNSSSALINTPCNSKQSSSQTKGVFGSTFIIGSRANSQYPFAYFSLSDPNGQLSGASIKLLRDNNKKGYDALPPWSFVEIGSGSDSATIDTSQVDFIGFPMNVTAKLNNSPGSSFPQWNEGVGFSYDPTGAVNMAGVLGSYSAFVKTLTPRDRTNYSKLSYKAGKDTVLLNPGNYLGGVNNSAFSSHFLNLVQNYMWKPGWTGELDTKAALGQQAPYVPPTKFSGKAIVLDGKNGRPAYPGYSGKQKIYAIEFTAQITSTVKLKAYVLSPASYQLLCRKNAIGGACGWMSPAYQAFATDGALNTPRVGDAKVQFDLLSGPEKDAWANYGGYANYNAVVARLGFMISMAFNHGVAGGLSTPGGLCDGRNYGYLSECWSDQRLWYPAPSSAQGLKTLYFNGDTTQNQFARWLHTAQIPATSGTPMMTRPVGAIRSAGGIPMGMGYGFASDENPTPPNSVYAQTPSKYDGNVDMEDSPACNYIVIMPSAPGTQFSTPVTDASKCAGTN